MPAEEAAVYRMLCRADSLGVFQVESRAQMSMLPRLRPDKFYDLVIEVAIVRPGPIQGDMVHPYLRRRQGIEKVSYPSKALEAVLGKTLGVPLFQEQAMKIAIVAGGFTPGEADQLRRAMATFKRTGTIGTFKTKMIEGMVGNGYPRDFAERCFKQIEGFGEYGFPESHAASFALLVYASAWLKCRYPDAFAAALLNAQPMGFYAPAQIVRDVREHGVEVRPVDVNHSEWDATLEDGPRAADTPARPASRDGGRHPHDACAAARLAPDQGTARGRREADRAICALQLGARSVAAHRAVAARHRAAGRRRCLRLARPDAPAGAVGRQGARPRRRQGRRPAAVWRVATARSSARSHLLPLRGRSASEASREGGNNTFRICEHPPPHPSPSRGEGADCASGEVEHHQPEPEIALPAMAPGEEVVNDYRFLQLTLRAHPASFLRADLDRRGIVRNEELRTRRSGERVAVSGLVTIRQRPGTAQGVIFMTIEDETGIANIIVWPKTFERFRPLVLGARYIAVTGEMQKESDVIHVVAHRLDDLTPLLARLTEDLPPIESLARADAVKRPHDENVDRRARGRRNPAQIAAPLARHAGERSRRAGARHRARALAPRRQQAAARQPDLARAAVTAPAYSQPSRRGPSCPPPT